MQTSKSHLLDLKLPLGGLLSFYGMLLTGYGLVTDVAMYEKSLGINLNIGWGILMLAIGLVFVAMHVRSKNNVE